MQTFKINRNSWHYRMNRSVWNAHGSRMDLWERSHSNFCAYWRATVFRIIGIMFMSAFIGSAIVVLSFAVASNPLTAGIAFLVIIGVLGGLIGIALAHEYIKEYKEKNPEPKTLVGKQYAAYKSKICPSVEFDQ